MKRRALRIVLLLVALLAALAGCFPPAISAPASSTTMPEPQAPATRVTTPTRIPQAAAPAELLSVCPPATEELQRLVRPEGLYCLAYPAQYKVERPNPEETILVIGGMLNAGDPRVHIRVTDAAGETAASAADRIVRDFPDFTLERATTTVAGEQAVVLDKAPGQEINRRVLFVRGGLLYELMFMPADPAVGEAFQGMNALQEQILGSFTFLPAGAGIADECLSPSGGAQLRRDATAGYCLLYPAGYSVEQTDAAETVFYSGSLLDVSKPKMFIRAEIEKSGLGGDLGRPFGLTLGYQRAERLDNVPGQDLSRVMIVVNGPRAYRLTFVPADPAQGDAYAQMESLYDLAMRSFRFLP
ncbi:MAG: hypothetical protein MUC34_06525 [Anaerolineae bacterium]|nr:hypothetical protein [Anaerolineae bacterium]